MSLELSFELSFDVIFDVSFDVVDVVSRKPDFEGSKSISTHFLNITQIIRFAFL